MDKIFLIEILIPITITIITLVLFSDIFMHIRDFIWKIIHFIGKNKYTRFAAYIFMVVGIIYIIVNRHTVIANIKAQYSFFLILPLIFIVIGAICNLLVMGVNKGKMPVYLGRDYKKTKRINDDIHRYFNFKTRKKVKLFLLCDRIHVYLNPKPNKKTTLIVSIGDLLMFYGLTLAIINSLLVSA